MKIIVEKFGNIRIFSYLCNIIKSGNRPPGVAGRSEYNTIKNKKKYGKDYL